MPKLYKIDAEEISKLVSESKKPRAKKQKLVNSKLPAKHVPKIERIPIGIAAKLPTPEPSEFESEPIEEEPVIEVEPEPIPEPEPVIESIPEPVIPMDVEEEPPKWFQKFVLQVKEEQERQAREAGERKVPQRVIKEEAEQIAQERWQDPKIREKVETKINKNLQSIYSMVFPNRQY